MVSVVRFSLELIFPLSGLKESPKIFSERGFGVKTRPLDYKLSDFSFQSIRTVSEAISFCEITEMGKTFMSYTSKLQYNTLILFLLPVIPLHFHR